MITIQKIKHDKEEFLMIFLEGKWWYVAKQIADYLEYSSSNPERSAEVATKLITNKECKMLLKKKGNEELFAIHLPSVVQINSKTNQVQLIDEDGLLVLALNSNKPNAKLLVQDMIKIFKVELDKAGLSALEYLLRIEKDKNILINARATKYYNSGFIKYTPMLINMSINELVYYKFFPNTNYSNDINTEKLRLAYEVDSELKDRDVSQDRYNVGNSILEMLYNYYLFNGSHMSLKQAKYLYVKNNGYDDCIVNLFENRLAG